MHGVWRTLKLAFLAALFGAGWLAGDRFGVPQPVRDGTDVLWGQAVDGSRAAWAHSELLIRERIAEAATFDFDGGLPELPSSIRAEDLEVMVKSLRDGSVHEAASPSVPSGGALALVKTCKGMSVSNAPRVNGQRLVVDLPERRIVNGIAVRTVPVTEGCLSSGHGPRGGKIHRGVDFHHPTGSHVISGASGTIVEAGYRDDYGNYLIIDHGEGVYTRYAHLASFGQGIRTGKKVEDGQTLGRMGNTAGWPMPIHLHYELLTGNYDTAKRSFGLTSANPFEAGTRG